MSYDRTAILLIEEDPILAEVISRRLDLLGYDVPVVDSGDRAIRTIKRELPDAIVVDLTLPDMDGVELIDRFSNDERTSSIPILVLSSSSDLSDVERAHDAGADDYLVIPFNPLLLEEKLEGLLRTIRYSV